MRVESWGKNLADIDKTESILAICLALMAGQGCMQCTQCDEKASKNVDELFYQQEFPQIFFKKWLTFLGEYLSINLKNPRLCVLGEYDSDGCQ